MTEQDEQAKLAALMQGMFRWPIGAMLTHRSEGEIPSPPPFPKKGTIQERADWRYAYSGIRREPIYTVTERLAQQCPGGIQLHYKCRVNFFDHTLGITTGVIDFLEQELRELTEAEPLPEPAPKLP